MLAAFPDVTVTLQEAVAEGDRVGFRSVLQGSHLGEFLGIPPTWSQVTVTLVDVLRIEDGRIAERWAGPTSTNFCASSARSSSPGPKTGERDSPPSQNREPLLMRQGLSVWALEELNL